MECFTQKISTSSQLLSNKSSKFNYTKKYTIKEALRTKKSYNHIDKLPNVISERDNNPEK